MTGRSPAGTTFAVAVTGGIKGSKGNVGCGTGGNTGRTGGATGKTGRTTGSTGGNGGTGGSGGGMNGGWKTLSPYAIATAELIVLPNRLNELLVEIVPVPTVFARKLDHRIRFCNCLRPNLNKNLPSLDVADKSVDDLRIRCLLISSGDSWYDVMYRGDVCANTAMGLVETSWSGTSDISNHPKETQNTLMNMCFYRFIVQRYYFLISFNST